MLPPAPAPPNQTVHQRVNHRQLEDATVSYTHREETYPGASHRKMSRKQAKIFWELLPGENEDGDDELITLIDHGDSQATDADYIMTIGEIRESYRYHQREGASGGESLLRSVLSQWETQYGSTFPHVRNMLLSEASQIDPTSANTSEGVEKERVILRSVLSQLPTRYGSTSTHITNVLPSEASQIDPTSATTPEDEEKQLMLLRSVLSQWATQSGSTSTNVQNMLLSEASQIDPTSAITSEEVEKERKRQPRASEAYLQHAAILGRMGRRKHEPLLGSSASRIRTATREPAQSTGGSFAPQIDTTILPPERRVLLLLELLEELREARREVRREEWPEERRED